MQLCVAEQSIDNFEYQPFFHHKPGNTVRILLHLLFLAVSGNFCSRSLVAVWLIKSPMVLFIVCFEIGSSLIDHRINDTAGVAA